ncbi:hypothetical protein BGZ60DRAFT_430889 [Tricladium varicosporioides]|nr:hypothetical protein BGZ60DRAFT_430889 [Hymenoscyphus varicosporioides]
MAVYQLGAAVNLDAPQSIQAIWGTTVAVYNFFSKNSMQPAAMVGINYGELKLGYPGKNIVLQIKETPYGPRWLGILAVASLITKEYSGGAEIYRLLKTVANQATAEYNLDKEQTEKMWTMGREIFLDSPVHREFLTIISQCAMQCNTDILRYAYPPDSSDFLPTVMMAAFRVWEMANMSSRGNRKIWAQGAMGIGHLILYLSAVCGFHVTVRLDEGEAHFGDPKRLIEVVVVLDREVKGEWTTGFLMDNLSIEESLQHWLGGEPKSDLWGPSRAAFAPIHPSTYTLYDREEKLDSAGTVNLSDLVSLKTTLSDSGSQKVLRDVGPNRDWQVMNQLEMFPGNWSMIPSTLETKKLMNCIASRLAGRLFSVQNQKLMGLTAGGAVIGLKGNEAQSIHIDPGHCMYIIPGSMETPERRIKEIYEEHVGSGFGRWGNAAELDQVRTPRDGFGDGQYDHVIQLQGDSAYVRTSIKFGEKACLGQCATGCLTDKETEQVQVVDASNYGMLAQGLVNGQPTRAYPKLVLVLAHNNTSVQRAIVSHSTTDVCMLQMGQCVHCAVRAALMLGVKTLID